MRYLVTAILAVVFAFAGLAQVIVVPRKASVGNVVTGGDCTAELGRGADADWKIKNSSGVVVLDQRDLALFPLNLSGTAPVLTTERNTKPVFFCNGDQIVFQGFRPDKNYKVLVARKLKCGNLEIIYDGETGDADSKLLEVRQFILTTANLRPAFLAQAGQMSTLAISAQTNGEFVGYTVDPEGNSLKFFYNFGPFNPLNSQNLRFWDNVLTFEVTIGTFYQSFEVKDGQLSIVPRRVGTRPHRIPPQ